MQPGVEEEVREGLVGTRQECKLQFREKRQGGVVW